MNCTHKSNEQVKQATCFNFAEISWLLAEHKGAEGREPYNRTAGRVPDKSNNLVFFSFAMAPKYIYLENLWHKHLLNPARLTLCLAMCSDRIIVIQGKSLVRSSLNWYVMRQIVYVSHFHQSQYFILRPFWWGNFQIWKITEIFTFGIWRSILSFMEIWYSS